MVSGLAATGGGRAVLSIRDGFTKNVHFCFGKFTSIFKALCGVHVHFCILTPKSGF
jgi:hypothetical protein